MYYEPQVTLTVLDDNSEAAPTCPGKTNTGVPFTTTVSAECSFTVTDPGDSYTAQGSHTAITHVTEPGAQEYIDYLNLYELTYYGEEQPGDDGFYFQCGGCEEGGISEPDIPVGTTYSFASTTTPACHDDRDTMIAEYVNHKCPYVPKCGDFVNSTTAPFTANFGLSNLNYGYFSDWALIRSYFVTNIQAIYNQKAFTINSGYRDPDREYDVVTSQGYTYQPSSRHQFGDAIDIATNSSTWNTYDGYAKNTAVVSVIACVEPTAKQGNSYGHLHADWRTEATAFARWTHGCPPLW